VRTPICDQLGIAHPIFAFTPSEHVAAAVSRAGGLGVLGCVRFNDAEELDAVLDWMDENTDGKPYGVDIVMPAKVPEEGTATDLGKYIPDAHRKFVDDTLRKLGVPPLPADGDPAQAGVLGWLHSVARAHVDVALKHPIKLIANALGSPPKDVIDLAHGHGVPVAALAGKAKHARAHVDNGVDIVVAQGTEAGGHTGTVATMPLVPQIVDAVGERVPVVAAGGIFDGRGLAAAIALGADGVWLGTRFIATPEARTVTGYKDALLRAHEDDTVISRGFTGKTLRALRNEWTQHIEQHPEELSKFPEQMGKAVAANALHLGGDENTAVDPDKECYPSGQGVGAIEALVPAGDLVRQIVDQAEHALARAASTVVR
jgi:NAD(P)H-dependent flavin oxidoreductase YrpB (nitropropane dioxygenase family)